MKFLGCLLMMLVAQTISDQKILSVPYGQTGPGPCARTCSGVASYKDTGDNRWTDYHGKAYKRADITESGFVSAPIVTALVNGPYSTPYYPSIRVWSVSSTMIHEVATPSNMVRYQCVVYWIATGYIC